MPLTAPLHDHNLQVVMKKIDIHDMSNEERRTAQREASLLASLRHPAVLHHIESFEDGGFLCIVTEFCEKGDLAARLERQRGVPLAEGVILDWFAQILLALLYVHKKHVLHRDLVRVAERARVVVGKRNPRAAVTLDALVWCVESAVRSHGRGLAAHAVPQNPNVCTRIAEAGQHLPERGLRHRECRARSHYHVAVDASLQ